MKGVLSTQTSLTGSVQSRWRRSSLAETDASDHASAQCYGSTEDVRVVPIVVAEFEFGDIQRQILPADLVKATHNAALQERPEAVDCLSVDNAINVLLLRVPNDAVRKGIPKIPIAGMFVSGDEADLFAQRSEQRPFT